LGEKVETRIPVRLRPRGKRDELIGMRDGVLQARVAAPPVDGRANRALCRLIAKRLGTSPSSVTVLRGSKSRDKVVAVAGLGEEEVESILRSLGGTG
jgi:uncharacterized protein (TIGR00251 family)